MVPQAAVSGVNGVRLLLTEATMRVETKLWIKEVLKPPCSLSPIDWLFGEKNTDNGGAVLAVTLRPA